MKIAFVVPEDDWSLNLAPELIKLRHEVIVNDCSEDCDVLFAIERTLSEHTMALHRKYPKVPLIMNNWDWFDYTDKTKGTWPLFIQLLKESKEVWSGCMETLKITEKAIGIKSEFALFVFILPWEWEGEKKNYGYIMKGSRVDPNKRFGWYKQAAEELDIPYKAYHLHVNTRPDYVRTMKNCSFYVSASKEEGIAIPPLEAAYCKKPILISDGYGWKGICGDNATYYKVNDFEDFKSQMKWLWENYKTKEIQDKVEKLYKIVTERFLPHIMAERVSERLKKVL